MLIIQGIQEGLAEEGWPEGSVAFEARYGYNDPARIAQAADELVATAPDVLIGVPTPAVAALSKATSSIPIVFTHISDPIGMKFVESFAQPGGNITGFTNFEPAMGGKWLQLLRQIKPDLSKATMVFSAAGLSGSFYVPALMEAASALGVEAQVVQVHDLEQAEPLIENIAGDPSHGLVFSSDNFVYSNAEPIVAKVNAVAIPAIYPFPQYAKAGGLMTYMIDEVPLFLGAGRYAGRILNGAKPADLPVQAPAKFLLSLNLRTAEAQGLTVPPEPSCNG